MDYKEFLENGIPILNPKYQKGAKGSKKKPKQPKVIISNNYEDFEKNSKTQYDKQLEAKASPVANTTNASRVVDLYNTYKPKDKDPKKWQVGENTKFNELTTQEEINRVIDNENRIRAENQSNWAKFGDAIVQAVGNELVLGTFKGLSDLVDAGLNKLGLVDDDYSNWFSKVLEEAQDYIRDEFKIYQKDPKASWAFGDFGYLMNNAVSIVSTASIFLPVAGAGKFLSLIGKASRLNKLGRGLSYGIGKMAKGLKMTNSPGRLAITMNRGAKITRDAFLSRTVENYQEAREVYKEIYKDAENRLANMTDEEREEFYQHNPSLRGLSDEEITKKIASLSADETFEKDYWMLAMDIMQYKALAGMWRGTTKTNVSAGVRGYNKRAAKMLNETGEAAEKNVGKITMKDRWNAFKDSPLKTATQSMTAVEWSEGIEEGFQNIQTERGKEVAEKIFDPRFQSKTLGDYLSEAGTWEAAFWGVLGGVGFKKLANITNMTGDYIEEKWNKHKIFGKEISLTGMSVEKAQAAEIASRHDAFIKLKEDMDLVNNGFHPTEFATDEKGEPIEVNGEVQRKELSKAEQAAVKQELLDNFLTTLTINAAENGTYDLLKEFLNDANVKQYFETNGFDSMLEDENFSSYSTRKMDEVYDTYSDAVYSVFNSVDVTNEHLGKLTARAIAKNKLDISNLNDKRNEVLNKINQHNTENIDYQAYYDKVLEENIDKRLTNLNKRKQLIERAYSEESISKQARDLYIEEVDDDINRLEKLIESKHSGYKSIVENFTDEEKQLVGKSFVQKFNKFLQKRNASNTSSTQSVTPKESLQKYIDVLADIDNSISDHENAVPKSQQDYKDMYERRNILLDTYVRNKYNKAAKKVRKWIKNQKDLQKASELLAKGEIKEIQQELDILKIGHITTKDFMNSIEVEVGAEMERRQKEAEAERTVTVDGRRVNEERGQQIRNEIENNASPTGEEIQAKPTESSESTESAEETNPTVLNEEELNNLSTDEEGQIVNDEIDIPGEEVNTAIEELDTARNEIAETVLSNDDLAASIADTFIRTELVRNHKDEILSLDVNDYNTTKYKELVNKIIEHLLLKGVSQTKAPYAAEKALSIVFKNLSNIRNEDKFLKLANQIASNLKVQRDSNGRASGIDFIGKEELNELIEDFINEYVKKRDIRTSRNGKTIINVENLVDYLVNKSDLSIEEAKYILRNIRAFINANQSRKFIFDKKSVAYGISKDISGLVDAIAEKRAITEPISEKTRISQLSNAEARSAAREAIRKRNDSSKITAKRTGKSIELSLDGVPIGFLGTVTNDAQGKNLRLNIDEDSKKRSASNSKRATFYYTINTDGNGKITTNLDSLFEGLINLSDSKMVELHEAINQIETYLLTGEGDIKKAVDKILNNKVIKELINNGSLVLPEKRTIRGDNRLHSATDISQAIALVEAINGILKYDKRAESKHDLLYSYNKWKKSIKQNYEETKKIQEAVDAGRELNIDIAQTFDGLLNYDNNVKNKANQVFQLTRDSVGKYNHPIVYATDDLGMVDDNGNTYSNRAGGLQVGDMGILVEDKNGLPMIAKITDCAKVNDTPLGEHVNAEIYRLFEKFVTDPTNPDDQYKRFDDLYEALSDLMGGKAENGNGKGGDHMFYGYQVIKTNNYIGIAKPGARTNEGFIAIIHKNRYGTQQAGSGITIFDSKYPGGKKSFFALDKPALHGLADKITSGLKFNRMFFMAKNRQNPQAGANRYFKKVQSGNESFFQVTIGGHRINYQSYTQFAHNNGIFYTNQKMPVNGSYYKESANAGTIYITTSEQVTPQTPVKEQTTNRSLKDIIETSNENNPASALEILQSTGISKAEEQLINGEVDGIPKLIPDEVIYDKETKLSAYTKDGKVYIGKKGITSMKRGKSNALRLLIHERLHNLLEETNEFKKANIVRDLLTTFNEAVRLAKEIKKGQPFYKEAKAFLDIVNKNFSLENYIKAIENDPELLKRWNESTQEEREEWFAEEWLVESLTQPNLIKLLNNLQYGDTKVSEVKNKSIWQKIIETLLKLFHGKTAKINDFTILAEQFRILGENNNNKNNESQTAENSLNIETAEIENNIDEVTPVRNSENLIDLGEDTNDTLSDEDLWNGGEIDYFASAIPFIGEDVETVNEVLKNPNVDTAGVTFISNIDEYLNNFNEKDRVGVKKLLDDGYLQYACKI